MTLNIGLPALAECGYVPDLTEVEVRDFVTQMLMKFNGSKDVIDEVATKIGSRLTTLHRICEQMSL